MNKFIFSEQNCLFPNVIRWSTARVIVQGVKLLGGHFACLCRRFDFYEVKKNIFFKKKREILLHF